MVGNKDTEKGKSFCKWEFKKSSSGRDYISTTCGVNIIGASNPPIPLTFCPYCKNIMILENHVNHVSQS